MSSKVGLPGRMAAWSIVKQRSALVREAVELALKRTGWSKYKLRRVFHSLANYNIDPELIRMYFKHGGSNLSVERYLILCGLAGIPRPFAYTLWVLAGIPEKDEKYKKWIGCTVRYPSLKHYIAREGRERASEYNTPESFESMLDYIRDEKEIPARATKVANATLKHGQMISGRAVKKIT